MIWHVCQAVIRPTRGPPRVINSIHDNLDQPFHRRLRARTGRCRRRNTVSWRGGSQRRRVCAGRGGRLHATTRCDGAAVCRRHHALRRHSDRFGGVTVRARRRADLLHRKLRWPWWQRRSGNAGRLRTNVSRICGGCARGGRVDCSLGIGGPVRDYRHLAPGGRTALPAKVEEERACDDR